MCIRDSDDRAHDRAAQRRDVHAEAEGRGQHVPDGDRSPSRHGVVERAVDPLEDAAVGELRQPGLHEVVQPEPALVEQDRGGGHGDRLGGGGHPEDRVPAHRRAAVVAHGADGLDVCLPAPADQGDDARDPTGLDVPRQHLAHLAQALVGEAAVAAGHVDLPRPVVFVNF